MIREEDIDVINEEIVRKPLNMKINASKVTEKVLLNLLKK